MGEIADSVLDGSCCELCGTFVGDPVGFPRACAGCDDSEVDDEQLDSKLRRASNRETSNRILREKGYQFEERNEGAHLIVQTIAGVADFWPGTGKFIFRDPRLEGRGVFNLMNRGGPAQAAAAKQVSVIEWKPHMTPFAVRAYEQAGFNVVGAPKEQA